MRTDADVMIDEEFRRRPAMFSVNDCLITDEMRLENMFDAHRRRRS